MGSAKLIKQAFYSLFICFFALAFNENTGFSQAGQSSSQEEETTIVIEDVQQSGETTGKTTGAEPPPPPVLSYEPAMEVEADRSGDIYIEKVPGFERLEETQGVNIVEAGWGKMKLGGVLQVQFRASDLTDEGDKRTVDFYFKRMRIILSGSFLKDKVGYLIQGDMVNVDGFLLDARASVKPVSGLEFRLGRFIPDFTYFMPINVGRLMAIDYPLVTESLAVWRQVGMETIFSHKYFSIYAGVFNGMRFKSTSKADESGQIHRVSYAQLEPGYMSATIDNLKDENLGKDLFFRLIFTPPFSGLEFGGYVWYGMPQFEWLEPASSNLKSDIANLILFGAEARYINKKLSILAEYAMRRIYYPAGSIDPYGNALSKDPHVAQGAFLHLGYRFISSLEVMARGDYFDSDLDDSNNGRQIWGTLGLNYFLDDLHARMTIEYIMKSIQIRTSSGEQNDYDDHGIYFQLCLMI